METKACEWIRSMCLAGHQTEVELSSAHIHTHIASHTEACTHTHTHVASHTEACTHTDVNGVIKWSDPVCGETEWREERDVEMMSPAEARMLDLTPP